MRVASLHTYPVKGCHRLDHDGADVERWGLTGDRRWLITDERGRLVDQPKQPGLVRIQPSTVDGGLRLRAAGAPDLDIPEPDGRERVEVNLFHGPVTASMVGRAADEWLTAVLAQKARLAWQDRVGVERLGNGNRLLLTTSGSLDALNGWLLESGSPEAPVPMTRFRPNVVVAGAEPWVEDGWIGQRVDIGAVRFRVAKACDRCVITTIDQETGERGHEPLRTLAKHRKFGQDLLFGVYLVPESAGPIAVGDPVVPR